MEVLILLVDVILVLMFKGFVFLVVGWLFVRNKIMGILLVFVNKLRVYDRVLFMFVFFFVLMWVFIKFLVFEIVVLFVKDVCDF